MRDDGLYLEDIGESIDLVEQYLGVSSTSAALKALFFDDQRTQDAVLRRLETLVDAASHLSETLKARYPQISRRQLADFRNVLAHAYMGVRPELVWRIIVTDLPDLKTLVAQELGHSPSP
ncbi:MAG: HepT-like ribonuclease domain-containing protein [Dehalococcoidia bacterium]